MKKMRRSLARAEVFEGGVQPSGAVIFLSVFGQPVATHRRTRLEGVLAVLGEIRGGGPVWDIESGGTVGVRVADCQQPQSRARLKPETMIVTFQGFSPAHDFFDYTTDIDLVLSRAGDVQWAQKVIAQLNREFPQDTMIQNYWIPTIRAAVELNTNPGRAIEALKPAAGYEAGFPSPVSSLYPAYVRGLVYLKMGQGRPAAIEFQKMLDHPGIVGNYVTGALAHLQLGRAQAMMGDKAAARKSYQDFLILWKDADSDIPVYKQAKAEYARLK